MVTQLRHVLVQQVDAVVELVLLAAFQVEREPAESSTTSLKYCADVRVRLIAMNNSRNQYIHIHWSTCISTCYLMQIVTILYFVSEHQRIDSKTTVHTSKSLGEATMQSYLTV